MNELSVDKNIAKAATLNLEYRINSVVEFTESSEKRYLTFVKAVIDQIKVACL